jgi:hypothetical protein
MWLRSDEAGMRKVETLMRWTCAPGDLPAGASHAQQMRWSRRSADLLLQYAAINGKHASSFGPLF